MASYFVFYTPFSFQVSVLYAQFFTSFQNKWNDLTYSETAVTMLLKMFRIRLILIETSSNHFENDHSDIGVIGDIGFSQLYHITNIISRLNAYYELYMRRCILQIHVHKKTNIPVQLNSHIDWDHHYCSSAECS